MSELTDRERDGKVDVPAPSDPDDRRAAEGGILSNAIRRTDNSYAGRRNGEDLIGKDLPEEDEEDEDGERDEDER